VGRFVSAPSHTRLVTCGVLQVFVERAVHEAELPQYRSFDPGATEVDFAITLGGDGTVLCVSWLAHTAAQQSMAASSSAALDSTEEQASTVSKPGQDIPPA